jgi:tetratricopeptide (TPR) repeat protein
VGLFSQTQRIDSLKLILQNCKSESTKLLLEMEIESLKYNNRIAYWDSISNYAHRASFFRVEAKAKSKLGEIYVKEGNNYEAIELFRQCLVLSKKIGDKKEVANCLINIGGIYDDQGDIPKAIDYYNQSIALNKEINDKAGLSSSFINLGLLYYNQNEKAS